RNASGYARGGGIRTAIVDRKRRRRFSDQIRRWLATEENGGIVPDALEPARHRSPSAFDRACIRHLRLFLLLGGTGSEGRSRRRTSPAVGGSRRRRRGQGSGCRTAGLGSRGQSSEGSGGSNQGARPRF